MLGIAMSVLNLLFYLNLLFLTWYLVIVSEVITIVIPVVIVGKLEGKRFRKLEASQQRPKPLFESHFPPL